MNSVHELFLSELYMSRSTDHYLGDLPATQYACYTYCQYSHKSSYSWLLWYISQCCQLNTEGGFRKLAVLLVYVMNSLPYIFNWRLSRDHLVSPLVPKAAISDREKLKLWFWGCLQFKKETRSVSLKFERMTDRRTHKHTHKQTQAHSNTKNRHKINVDIIKPVFTLQKQKRVYKIKRHLTIYWPSHWSRRMK
jgi:hypothetical protein